MLRVHKWCGLTACLLILIQAVTGIVNTFRHDVAQLVDPYGMVRHAQDAEAPLTDILRSLNNTHAELTVERLVFPEEPNGTYLAHMLTAAGDKVYSSVDPGNAEILRSGRIWRFPSEAAKRIHYNYIIGLPGLFIVAVTGLLGLLLAATGMTYWWPRRGRPAQQLRVNWIAPGTLVLRQIHRSIGVLMSLLIGFSLVTGLVLSVDYIIGGIGRTAGSHVDVSMTHDFDIDYVVHEARSQYPSNDIRDIRFIGGDRANVFFRAPKHGPLAVSMVGIDLREGTIAETLDAESNTESWVTWLPLHSGKSFGIFGTVLVTTNALVLIGLALSGPTMWLNRVLLRRRRKSTNQLKPSAWLE